MHSPGVGLPTGVLEGVGVEFVIVAATVIVLFGLGVIATVRVSFVDMGAVTVVVPGPHADNPNPRDTPSTAKTMITSSVPRFFLRL